MNKLLVWFLLLAACQQGEDETPIDPDLQAVLDAAVLPGGGSEEDTLVYRVANLEPGAVVAPFFDGDVTEIDEATTLFLVDPLPDAGWSKPVQWVYLDDDGDVHVVDADWFPIVNDEAFDPAYEDAAWGVGGEATAHLPAESDIGEPSTARRRPPPTENPDPCTPEKTDVALTIAGWNRQSVRNDELNMSNLLGKRHDFEISRVTADQASVTIKREIENTLAQYAARPEGSIDELVIYYAGHGAKKSGSWVLGKKDTGTTVVTATELAAWIAAVPADRVTIISESCFSGAMSQSLETALRTHTSAEDMELTLIHAASSSEYSFTGGAGGVFTVPFIYNVLLPFPVGSDIPWNEVGLPGPFDIVHRGEDYVQTPGRRYAIPVPQPHAFVPEGRDEVASECVDGFLPPQTYDRELRIEGEFFGDDRGLVLAQAIDGQWHELDIVYWSDTDIILHMPMRRDGFPSDGHSPARKDAHDGRYLVELVRLDDGATKKAVVEVTLQSYSGSWSPDYDLYDHPEWNEMWHPVTPPTAPWTEGATIQLSALYDAQQDLTPQPELSDIPALHQTSQTVQGTPYWGYDLFPADRDLQTAFEQSYPEFRYYGFRQVFSEDFTFELTWTFDLAYD